MKPPIISTQLLPGGSLVIRRQGPDGVWTEYVPAPIKTNRSPPLRTVEHEPTGARFSGYWTEQELADRWYPDGWKLVE